MKIKTTYSKHKTRTNCNWNHHRCPKLPHHSTQVFSPNIEGSIVTPSTHIRNLSIILNPNPSFLPHVNQITKTAFFHPRNIACLWPSLSFSIAETLISAFITSRLDYYNSILYGSPNHILNNLQYVQNSAARMLTSTRHSDHITPVLHDLHWLKIKYRIDFKILLTTFKISSTTSPCGLVELSSGVSGALGSGVSGAPGSDGYEALSSWDSMALNHWQSHWRQEPCTPHLSFGILR